MPWDPQSWHLGMLASLQQHWGLTGSKLLCFLEPSPSIPESSWGAEKLLSLLATTSHLLLEASRSETACPRFGSQLPVKEVRSPQTHDLGPGSSQSCPVLFYQHMLLSRMFLGLAYKSPLDSRSLSQVWALYKVMKLVFVAASVCAHPVPLCSLSWTKWMTKLVWSSSSEQPNTLISAIICWEQGCWAFVLYKNEGKAVEEWAWISNSGLLMP